ncbi:MAG TPA: phosphatase PAP2 family protein [Chromatiaceae bacterium]|jgi:membrane-associated phospholipid phosphatase|nr:MAG: hypothetical protein N838_05400 [Thiohalocapsa sp. PB-PSB1]QQO52886.1 MAG: phosphatase PAP2 family protein [Thiohalocapsa sp. PB-PSB1]HBG94418.1 phosphatase PAP2 family protein [Chromatiaceae bacterium]HCS88548.1 phosphatase PAP2 family protein [Chromatiaceae bacterium]
MNRNLIASLHQELRAALEANAERDPNYSRIGVIWLSRWALCAMLVGILLYLVGGYQAGFLYFNGLAAQGPDWPWEWLTLLGDERVAFALTLLFARQHPRVFWTLICAALLAIAYSRGLKPLLDQPRPPAVLAPESFHLIGPGHHNQSFPSGHSVTAAVFFAVLVYYAKWLSWRLLFVSLAVLAGLSRIAVGVHWPVDVAAGLAGGVLAALIGVWLAGRSTWGIHNSSLHLILIAIAASMAVSLWFDNGGYAAATLPLRLLSIFALSYAALVYLVLPYRRTLRHQAQRE